MIKIRKMDLFHTPSSQDELMDWIESLATSEKAVAITVFGMTWNFLAEQVNNSQDSEEEEIEA